MNEQLNAFYDMMNDQDIIKLFRETKDDRLRKYVGDRFVIFLHDVATGYDALMGHISTFPDEIERCWLHNKKSSPQIKYLNFFTQINPDFWRKAYEYAFTLDPDKQIEKIELNAILESDFSQIPEDVFRKIVARYTGKPEILEECEATS
jgi:hypothetical protein